MRSVLWLVIAGSLVACVASTARPDRPAVGTTSASPAMDVCRTIDGQPLSVPVTLAHVMSEAINPALTQISMHLFHDPRPIDDETRNEELASAASALSRCFLAIPALYQGPEPNRVEFKMQAILQSHNGLALGDAVHQRDRNGQLHWFLHIKETCQSCHEQFRFRNRQEPLGASW
jgi:hypothetical protein